MTLDHFYVRTNRDYGERDQERAVSLSALQYSL